MELKKSITKQHFDKNAKKYVINMKNNSKKLHKKNNCQYSKHITEYYDFDTLEEAKTCGVNFTYCRNCFTEDETVSKQPENDGAPTPMEVYKKYSAYWSGIRVGLIGLFVGAICLIPCLQWIRDIDFSDFDSCGPIIFGLVSMLLLIIASIVSIVRALIINEKYKKYYTDRIKAAHKSEERLIKTICIVTGVITSIVLIIVFSITLSDKKSNNNTDDDYCSFCHENYATRGDYCRECYETLDNIRDAYE